LFEELGEGREGKVYGWNCIGQKDGSKEKTESGKDKNQTNSTEPPRDRKKEKNIQHTGNIPLDQIYDVSPPPSFIPG
jgi:hypothetical protein